MNDENIGYLIKILNNKLKMQADAELKKSGLTFTQTKMIGYIHYCKGHTTQKDIENHFNVSHPTVVGILDRLHEKGFVYFESDKKDKRIKNVFLTEKACKLNEKIKNIIDKNEKMLLDSLTEEDKSILKKYLITLYENISKNMEV